MIIDDETHITLLYHHTDNIMALIVKTNATYASKNSISIISTYFTINKKMLNVYSITS